MQENKNPKQPTPLIPNLYFVILLITLILNAVIVPQLQNARVKEVSYNVFMDLTSQKKIDKVQVDTNQIVFTEKGQSAIYKTGVMTDPDLTQRLYNAGADFRTDIVHVQTPMEKLLYNWVIPIIFMIIFWQILSRQFSSLASKMGGGMGGGLGGSPFGNFGKSNAKEYVKSTDGIHFHDVAGEDEAKESLQEIVQYLKDPSRYTAIGAQMPKGILLVGPPGTGKTLLAKAVAGESNVPFFSISGSEFVEMFVGMGASKVRDLFQQAKAKAPCIVFIDEIDAIGGKRTAGSIGGNDEREQTLNQLLTEMDGFEGNSGVIILAATNRPESLDPALLRPGRFDRRIPVELPDLKGREEILKVHAKKVRLADNVNFHTIARMASGASGAELANIINEAALRAVRNGRKVANQQDLEESVETVIAGYQKKNAVLTDKEKATVAYHEIGHALVAALQSHSAPVQKITIIPRTSGALGYTLQVEEHDKYLYSKEDLLNKICTYTAGRAAEEVEFGVITTGASNDIEQATKIARALITQYGMDPQFGMVQLSQRDSRYLGDETHSTCSEKTLEEIDKRVVTLVQEQHDKAVALLRENKDKLNALAQFLYEKETITGEQFMDILNRPSAYASLAKPFHSDESLQ